MATLFELFIFCANEFPALNFVSVCNAFHAGDCVLPVTHIKFGDYYDKLTAVLLRFGDDGTCNL